MCYTERLIRAESCQKDIHLTAFLAELTNIGEAEYLRIIFTAETA